jgi:hypothetical protein
MVKFTKTNTILLSAVTFAFANGQSTTAPNVYNVLSWSSVFNQTVYNGNGQAIGVLNRAVPSIYAFGANGATVPLSNLASVLNPTTGSFTNYQNVQADTSIIRVNNAVNSSIATALGVIPLASPAAAVIFKKDPLTGADLPATSTLGPVFTERAETIGKHKWYIGVTHDDFHFTKLDGQSLNSLQVLYTGGTTSGIQNGSSNLTSYPATFNIGMDVRLSQDVALITYGVTDRFDVSVGLPVVHSAVAARTYNGILYAGGGVGGEGAPNNDCWCAGTFNPIAFAGAARNFTLPGTIGQASLGKTGFGDLLVRLKGSVVSTKSIAVAVGTDVRFATGDAENYLGTGAASVKPFVAVSLFTQPTAHGIVFAPHFNLGWQFSGQSVLGGQLQPNSASASMTDGSGTVNYQGAPLTATKGDLPDVLTWAVGSEVAFGKRNTVVIDILGNEIGTIHGVPNLITGSAAGFSPFTSQSVTATGLIGSGTTSYSQFSGAFGYKANIVGHLVFTFSALTRFDSNGLTARFTPLYGLGYSF